MDEFLIRLGKTIGYGTGLFVGRDDLYYLGLGRFAMIVAIIALCLAIPVTALAIADLIRRKHEIHQNRKEDI